MTRQRRPATRRAFLGGALTTIAGAQAATALGPGSSATEPAPPAHLAATLRAVADVVLPRTALGEGGVANQVEAFERWSAGFEPVAELDHPYLSSDELRYGPPDPRPNWRAQLEALDTEARLRWDTAFHDAAPSRRRSLVEREIDRLAPVRPAGPDDALEESPAALPFPFAAEAPHVAIALLSWFVSTSSANDLCYRAAIGRHECRGLPSASAKPESLGDSEPAAGSKP